VCTLAGKWLLILPMRVDMTKKRKQSQETRTYRLPKDALQKITLGQPHAEHDRIRRDKSLLVRTPAVISALNSDRSKCFFVGRRGTGKTAITYFLELEHKNTIQINPDIFDTLGEQLDPEDLRNPRQRPFHSLVSCFHRAIVDEVFAHWIEKGMVSYPVLAAELTSERNLIDSNTFDTRMITFMENILLAIRKKKDRDWARLKSRPKEIGKALQKIKEERGWGEQIVIIDRIDDSWDGSDQAVLLLMALMHACLEVSSSVSFVRPLLFLRENIFERVRDIDYEFSRLETCVVSLDWTREMLIEVIERRIHGVLNPKPPLGEVWDCIFEKANGKSSKDLVFDYCQERPRDVITYCTHAVETAQSKRHQTVSIEDLLSARRRFSESRLKDLGDEYSENFPQIQVLLSRFYGLAREFTINAVNAFIQKILSDSEVTSLCKEWLYKHTAPHKFIELLYGIGFLGIKTGSDVEFRGLGARSSSIPPISPSSHIVIHPTYADALVLQDKVLGDIDEDLILKSEGLLLELPDAIDLSEYNTRLADLLQLINDTPTGNEHDQEYERIVGDIVRLCFFRHLTNVALHVRDIDGRVVRDWIASNVATIGFWYSMKEAYAANQIIWECKNCHDLSSSDFHQCSYYMNDAIGRFVVVCFRGELKSHYYQHIKRISANQKGMVLLLTDKDLRTFVRQALNGKVKESHIQAIYDETVRKVS
jgi:hypothetical protein